MREHIAQSARKFHKRDDFRLWILYIGAIAAVWMPLCIVAKVYTEAFHFLLNLANAALIALPFVWLGRRFRWTVLVPVWGLAIYYFTNLPYSRFFYEFMPLRNYFMFGNWDAITFKAGVALMKAKDVVVLLPAIAYTILYISLRKSTINQRFTTKAKWIISAITVPAFILSEVPMIKDTYSPTDERAKEYYFGSFMYNFGPLAEYVRTGPATFFAKGIGRLIAEPFESRTLSKADVEQIEEFKRRHGALLTPYQAPQDNSDKNLIFIVVESLNAWAVDATANGRPIMPTLGACIDSAASISALKMQNQVILGQSADGQLMYNTGLYPCTTTPTVMKYADNDFRSLPKTFKAHGGRRAFEVISDKPGFWNHNRTTKAYGYDFYINNLEKLAADASIGGDEIIFSTALAAMDTVPQPFMAFITTISMHYPYTAANIPSPQWISEAEGLSDDMRNYLTVTNYFDTQLGQFLDKLKQKGLYDKSVIVIVSDHTAPVDGIEDDGNIVFVALNTGITQKVNHPIGQVDVFPTVLDIMGYDDPYRGMGLSIFNPNNTGAIDRHGNILGNNSAAFDSLLRTASPVANLIYKGNIAL